MTFVGEEEGTKESQELSLWVTKKDKIHIEIQPEDNSDAYAWQCIQLDRDDAEALRDELTRLLTDYDVK